MNEDIQADPPRQPLLPPHLAGDLDARMGKVIMATDTTESPIFLESSLSYRSPIYILAVLVFTPACIWMLCALVSTLVTKPVSEWFPGVLFFVLWLGMVGGCTTLLGWRMVWKPITDTRIDGQGIWIDARLHPWAKIHWLWGQQQANGVTLHFQEQSRLRLDQMIPLAQPLTQEGYDEFLEELGAYLAERFPHVDLG